MARKVEVGLLVAIVGLVIPLYLHWDAKRDERAAKEAKAAAEIAKNAQAVLNIENGVRIYGEVTRRLVDKSGTHEADISSLKTETKSLRRDVDRVEARIP
ncbi:hypothetical protein [Spongiibacter marinus]|uniref:hypothetical protein n=1 Tax=Spongiibacter marinus TaxID=354246 RepID=UPI00195FCF8F|nr:hypothetical protein [Spongiibacter marinus]MBM7424962.1 hypothetical protein [Spongiibacter marinus]